MKNLLITFVLLFVGYETFSQTHLYENPKFNELTSNHQIIGILPFKATVKLRPNQLENVSPEQLVRMEESEGYGIQSALYSWFLKRDKDEPLRIKILDINATNTKLNKAGFNLQNYNENSPKELAEILEVDAIIMGTFETTKPMSEGASVALGMLVGFWGSTNKAVLNLNIYNGVDGETLVNYNKAVSGSVGSSTEDLVNRLMRKSSRRIAYTD